MSNKAYSIEEVSYYFCKHKTIEVLGAKGPEKVQVYPAFPVPSERKDHSTAIRWARRQGVKPSHLKVANSPITNGRIASLSVRGQGGRAVQTIVEVDNKKLLVDMREAEFYPEILINGLDSGGYLRGDFAWVVNGGGHMSLIRHGSERWADAEAQALVRKAKPVKAKELEFGKAYKVVGGSEYVFLGRVNHPETGKKSFCFIESENRYGGRGFVTAASKSFAKQSRKRFEEIADFTTNENVEYGSYSWVNVVIRKTCPKLILKVDTHDVADLVGEAFPSNEEDFIREMQDTLNEQSLLFKTRMECSKLSPVLDRWGNLTAKAVPMPAWLGRIEAWPR